MLIIQALSSTGFQTTFFEMPGVEGQAVTQGIICDDISRHDGPGRHQHDPSQCCLFCCEYSDDRSFLAAAVFAAIILSLRPEVGSPPIYSTQEHTVLHQLGWNSSWSSTAPPQA